MSKSAWRVLQEQLYEQFRIFNIRKSTRLNPRTQQSVDFFLMNGLDWVNVIALTPQNEVVLVRQYRHGIDDYTIEIPGGCVEHGEDPKISGLRELTEETGYRAQDAIHLGTLCANPAMQSMRLHVYLATNAVLTAAQDLDPGEDISVFSLPLNEVLEKIKSGEINHALVVAAFGLFALNGDINTRCGQ